MHVTTVIGVLLLLAPAAPGPNQSGSEVERLFHRYHTELAVGGLVDLTPLTANIAEIRSVLERDGKRWPVRPKAAFVLEAVHAAFSTSYRGQAERVDLNRLLELGCASVRKEVVSPEYRAAWFRAAIAILEGPNAGGGGLPDLLDHARGHLNPEEIGFARGVALEQIALTTIRRHRPALAASVNDSTATSALQASRRTVADAIANFRIAERSLDLRFEAVLRRAMLQIEDGRPEAAIESLTELAAVTSDDAWLVSLVRFARGRALIALGRFAEADAVLDEPGSGAVEFPFMLIARATAAYGNGDKERASGLAALALSGTGRLPDPWVEYRFGDFRHLAARFADLRRVAR